MFLQMNEEVVVAPGFICQWMCSLQGIVVHLFIFGKLSLFIMPLMNVHNNILYVYLACTDDPGASTRSNKTSHESWDNFIIYMEMAHTL